jgi:hypothetical protein
MVAANAALVKDCSYAAGEACHMSERRGQTQERLLLLVLAIMIAAVVWQWVVHLTGR